MNIKQLAGKIRKVQKRNKSWRKTGKQFDITGAMAYRIAEEGYNPADEGIRSKLGLSLSRCPKCGRKIINKKKSIRQERPEFMKAWAHLPTEERQKVIQEYIRWKTG